MSLNLQSILHETTTNIMMMNAGSLQILRNIETTLQNLGGAKLQGHFKATDVASL